MTLDTANLSADPDGLRALLLAERARHAEEVGRIMSERDRLRAISRELQRHRFGRRSERLDPVRCKKREAINCHRSADESGDQAP